MFSDRKTLSYSRLVHLSHPIDPAMPLWPGDPPVEWETMADLDRQGYFLRWFSMGEHSGTHMNAPRSFFADGIGIDAYPAESLFVPAVVVDMREQAAADGDYCLGDRDLQQWEAQHGPIPAGSVVLLYTGWQSKWPDPQQFLNQDANGQPHFPGFRGETTRWLLDQRRIAGVGIDTHGVDGGLDPTFATNRQVLAEQGLVLECLTNLDQLPTVGIVLAIAPLRLRNGSGSPVSVLALVTT